MVALAPNTSETSTWDVLDGFPKLHSRAREVKTTHCTEASHSKSLDCVEIWLTIYEGCDGLESFTRDPIGFDGSEWNLYSYVDSRPLLGLDPSGLKNCMADWKACRRSAEADHRQCVRLGKRMCNATLAFDLTRCTGVYKSCMDPPKPGNNIINKVCGKVTNKLGLLTCEADCVKKYDGCLDSSLNQYTDCMESNSPQYLCDRIYNLNIVACPADYLACGLTCLTPF